MSGKLALATLATTLLAHQAAAQATDMLRLDTGDAARGWGAVARIDIDGKGFCTGTLIAENVVLTAAHCLFDKWSGAAIPPARVHVELGLRNGRAEVYRGVRAAAVMPGYVYIPEASLAGATHDLALLELDRPVRLPQLRPFETGTLAPHGQSVAVVSYAVNREDAATLEPACTALGEKDGAAILTCNADFGASGAPVFEAQRDGSLAVVGVVTAKARMNGAPVAVAAELGDVMPALWDALDAAPTGSAKFVSPGGG